MTYLLQTLRGILTALGLIIQVGILASLIFVFALLGRIPGLGASLHIADRIERLCAVTTYRWLRWCTPTDWQLDNPPVPGTPWLLATANHRSWLDVVLVGAIFHRLPPMRFFLKKALIWIPIVGQACWALGYAFMQRHTASQIRKNPALKGQDMAQIQRSCQRFAESPVMIVAFPEGTRYNPAKAERRSSPYQHLLVPQAAGIAATIQHMPMLKQWLDISLHYSNDSPTLWDFLCGRIATLQVRSELLSITDDLRGDFQQDRNFRRHFQQFLRQRWQLKDQWLSKIGQPND